MKSKSKPQRKEIKKDFVAAKKSLKGRTLTAMERDQKNRLKKHGKKALPAKGGDVYEP